MGCDYFGFVITKETKFPELLCPIHCRHEPFRLYVFDLILLRNIEIT